VLLATVIMATFVAWIWFWVPAELAYTTRTMIAWSFDRLAPDRLGHVSQRFHTPVVAIGLSTAGAIVFIANAKPGSTLHNDIVRWASRIKALGNRARAIPRGGDPSMRCGLGAASGFS
jgi:amino acid transporter